MIQVKQKEKQIAIAKTGIVEIIHKCLIAVFVFCAVLFPQDLANIKILSLGLLLIFAVWYVFSEKKSNLDLVIVIFGLGVTSVNIALSVIVTQDIYGSISIGYPGYVLLVWFIIKRYGTFFKRIFFAALKLICLMIVLFAALDLTNVLLLTANPIAIWFHNSGNAMIGYGTSITGIILFFKTTPLLLLLQNDYLKNGKYFRGFVVCIAMILSGTRANMLVSVFLIFAHFIFAEKNKNAKRIFCIIAVVVVLLVARRVFALVKELFDAKSGGDDVRSGHLRGILAFWKQNPISLFFGAGFSSEFFSYGTNSYLSNVELSYWNLCRQVGFIMFIILMAMYLYPLARLLKYKKKYLSEIFAYAGFLIIAYTNPFLYSTTGMIILLYMYYLFGSELQEREETTKSINVDRDRE